MEDLRASSNTSKCYLGIYPLHYGIDDFGSKYRCLRGRKGVQRTARGMSIRIRIVTAMAMARAIVTQQKKNIRLAQLEDES